jgi:hypothetical protein
VELVQTPAGSRLSVPKRDSRSMVTGRVSLVIVLAASLLPNYRVVAAIPLAYAIIVSGALIHNKRLRLTTDLSYGVSIYAFPMQ